MASQVQAKEQEKRFGWKSYTILALVAAITAGKLRKQFRRPVNPSEAKWYSPSESDLRQEHLDEMEQKERAARVQGAYEHLRSNYRNMRTAGRYQKWEENPQHNEESGEKKAKDSTSSKLAERSRLRHHYLVLGLDPYREQQFTEDEIKAAFRERALQFHPDKNPDNREEMRGKFRELMDSYKAIKSEKKIT